MQRTLIKTGARRLLRSFLCTHKKLISTMRTSLSRTRIVAGIALINATSFLLADTRTPAIDDANATRMHSPPPLSFAMHTSTPVHQYTSTPLHQFSHVLCDRAQTNSGNGRTQVSDPCSQSDSMQSPHTDMPSGFVPRRLQCPGEERWAVVKTKHGIVVLHIVVGQQRVHLWIECGLLMPSTLFGAPPPKGFVVQ